MAIIPRVFPPRGTRLKDDTVSTGSGPFHGKTSLTLDLLDLLLGDFGVLALAHAVAVENDIARGQVVVASEVLSPPTPPVRKRALQVGHAVSTPALVCKSRSGTHPHHVLEVGDDLDARLLHLCGGSHDADVRVYGGDHAGDGRTVVGPWGWMADVRTCTGSRQ